MKWVFLPAAVFWVSVTPVHGKLVVSGPLDRGPKCGYLFVDPGSRHSSFAKRSCAHGTGQLTPDIGWSVVRVGGRFVFRYSNASDSKVQWAYGGGSLWIYNVATDRGAMLFRYSLRTARLQQHVSFPRLYKPVLDADDAGAFLMANPSGGISGQRTAALYFVSPGAKSPRILQRGARAALWMTAHSRTLWLETVTGTKTFKLWRYDGTRGRVLWTHHRSTLYGTSYGDGALWGVSAPYCAQHVRALRINARTGAMRVIANVPLLDCNQLGPGDYYRGWFWFIDGNELMRVR